MPECQTFKSACDMGLTIGLGPACASGGGGGDSTENALLIDSGFFDVSAKNTDNSITEFAMIDTSYINNMSNMFDSCTLLKTIPKIDTSRVKTMTYMFKNCSGIESIPMLDMSSLNVANYMFQSCVSLKTIHQIDAPMLTRAAGMFHSCKSLQYVPPINCPKATDLAEMFYGCESLQTVEFLDLESCTSSLNQMFYNCPALVSCNLYHLKTNISFQYSPLISKDSILYLFSNAVSVSSTKRIMLHADTFNKLTADEIAMATQKGFSVVSA